jgi:cellulose biosynthesis protein BcsQ
LVLMLDVVEQVRADRQDGNPFLQVLGVLPTMVDQRWPDHRTWQAEMVEVCRERAVRIFPPISRRQSYTRLSVAGHDYYPVADTIRALVARERAPHAQGLPAGPDPRLGTPQWLRGGGAAADRSGSLRAAARAGRR